MPRLWIARHAAPLIAPGTCYGQLNVAADANATQQAARHLAEAIPQGLVVTHSPLQRCEQLALALKAQRPDLTSTPDARLMEMHFGAWEGMTWDAIGPEALAAWTDHFAGHAPGGGETLQTFMARVASALNDVRTSGRDSLWISHAGVARAASLIARGQMVCEHADQWPQAAPAFGAWTLLNLD